MSQDSSDQKEYDHLLQDMSESNQGDNQEHSEEKRTLAIIKPDAMNKWMEIEDIVMRRGFTILQKRQVHLTPEQASEFYSDHYGKMFFPSLIANISSGPIIAYVLTKKHAVSSWNEIIGHPNPFKAREINPQALRAIYGKDHTRNAVHGSDNIKSSEKEIGFMFPNSVLEPILMQQTVKDYITKQVNPILLNALAAVCKRKPVDPVTWLADWLIEHNPKKPSIREEVQTENVELN